MCTVIVFCEHSSFPSHWARSLHFFHYVSFKINLRPSLRCHGSQTYPPVLSVFNALEDGVSKPCMLNSSDSSLTWETATRCPPLIHNQPSNTPLPQWFNCPICHGCCSPQNKRHDNDHFQSPTRHATFHSWSKVSEMPQFSADEYFILSYLSPFLFSLLTLAVISYYSDEGNNEKNGV